jgi:3-hydroxyisobutyrate dehydrogenase-like beta-hydroxyacid dehydrogenase
MTTEAHQITIGLLHPGEMGAAIGAALVGGGHRVLWASAGRSAQSAARAEAAELVDAGTVSALADGSDVILSVIPPAEATTVAAQVAGFSGLYVDANAISPETARSVAGIIVAGGAGFVDGGIVGAPPAPGRPGRVYLSGAEAGRIAELFAGTLVDAVVAGAEIGDASAVKLAYAGWTKGSAALLLTMREYARRAGVEQVLLAEWERSQPQLPEMWEGASRSATNKGWRWVGEMQEIAAGLEAVELPGGFHEAAAEVFSWSPRPST